MDKDKAVAEYLRLTDAIKALSDERAALKSHLSSGRNFGSDRDIRVSETYSSRVDMFMLRRYVTPAVIEMCTTRMLNRSVAVVPKMKPKKVKV